MRARHIDLATIGTAKELEPRYATVLRDATTMSANALSLVANDVSQLRVVIRPLSVCGAHLPHVWSHPQTLSPHWPCAFFAAHAPGLLNLWSRQETILSRTVLAPSLTRRAAPTPAVHLALPLRYARNVGESVSRCPSWSCAIEAAPGQARSSHRLISSYLHPSTAPPTPPSGSEVGGHVEAEERSDCEKSTRASTRSLTSAKPVRSWYVVLQLLDSIGTRGSVTNLAKQRVSRGSSSLQYFRCASGLLEGHAEA